MIDVIRLVAHKKKDCCKRELIILLLGLMYHSISNFVKVYFIGSGSIKSDLNLSSELNVSGNIKNTSMLV